MQSFDVFDTLIARRCMGPLALYELVAQRSGIPGLASARAQAGHALWSRCVNHHTADIYALALEQLGLPGQDAMALAQLEFAQELEEVIPVARHLEGLPANALLLSDMHHPAWQIERLVQCAAEKVGIRYTPSLIVSNRGKHDGDLWQGLRASTGALHHLGDNQVSDGHQSRLHGHEPTVSTWALPNAVEVALNSAGAGAIARAARSARLRCVTGSNVLVEAMCSHVFPTLALGAMWLAELARASGAKRIAFVGRDGATWQRVFSALYPFTPVVRIHASRVALQRASQGLREHVNNVVTPDTLLADVCGSGASWQAFAQLTGVTCGQAVLLRYPTAAPMPASAELATLLQANELPGGAAMAFEALCEESYPSVADVQWLGHGRMAAAVPVHGEQHAKASQSPAAPMLHHALQVAIDELAFERARSTSQLNMAKLLDLSRQLVSALAPIYPNVDAATQFSARNRANSA